MGGCKMNIVTNINTCIDEILEHMRKGNPIIIPTDTNYNLACLANSAEAIDKIFKYKKRPKNKALSLFFLDPSDWNKYGICDNERIIERLAETFWPGPLNIIINKRNSDYDYMLNNKSTIALGSVSNPTWREFMSHLNGEPIAITSANISGTVDNTLVTKEIAISQMKNCVDFFIESSNAISTSKSSTIVSVIDNTVKLIREGDIDKKALDNALHVEEITVE